MDWEHETRRYLYVREDGTFAALPALTRGLAALLLKAVDDDGACVSAPRERPEETVARLCRAHKSESRAVFAAVSALIADGYLVVDGPRLLVRNYPAAQGVEPISADERTRRRNAEALKKAAQRAKKKRERLGTDDDVQGTCPGDTAGTCPGDKLGDSAGTASRARAHVPADAPASRSGPVRSGPSEGSEERETAQPPAAPLLRPPFGEIPSENEFGDEGERHVVEQRELISDPQAPGQAQLLVGLMHHPDLFKGVPVTALSRRMAMSAKSLPEAVDRAQIGNECAVYARQWAAEKKASTAKQRAAAAERKLTWIIADFASGKRSAGVAPVSDRRSFDQIRADERNQRLIDSLPDASELGRGLDDA